MLGCAGAAGAGQSPPKPPANDDCLACHGDPDAKRANGTSVAVDAPALAASTHGPMACVDCHADLATLVEFPHPDTLEKVNCASCHDDVGANYHDSIHSRAREKSGLDVAPACADCHGTHDIRGRTDPTSRVAHAQVPATCGRCHAGIKRRYDTGVHAAALKKGDPNAPVCADCHTAHDIQRADTDAWRLGVTAECGSCHASVVDVVQPHVPRQGDAARLRPRGRVRRLPRRARHSAGVECRVDGVAEEPADDMRQVPPGRQRALRPVRPASEPARLQAERGAVVGEPVLLGADPRLLRLLRPAQRPVVLAIGQRAA